MDKLYSKLVPRFIVGSFMTMLGVQSNAFELLSEGAMESVSAVSVSSAEEIISLAGATSAGLKVDDKYDSMPFKAQVKVKKGDVDKVSTDLNFQLTKEVENWATTLQGTKGGVKSGLKIGYVDVLPPSTFKDVVIVNKSQFDTITFDADEYNDNSTVYELGRVDQTIDIIKQNLDSVQYTVRRRVEYLATLNANPFNNETSLGSGFITNLNSVSNVKIAAVRE